MPQFLKLLPSKTFKLLQFKLPAKYLYIIFKITNNIQIVVHLVYILFCLISTYCSTVFLSTVCIDNLHQDSTSTLNGDESRIRCEGEPSNTSKMKRHKRETQVEKHKYQIHTQVGGVIKETLDKHKLK